VTIEQIEAESAMATVTAERDKLLAACKPIVDYVNAWTTRTNREPDEFPVLQAFNRQRNGNYEELIVNLGHLRSLKNAVDQITASPQSLPHPEKHHEPESQLH